MVTDRLLTTRGRFVPLAAAAGLWLALCGSLTAADQPAPPEGWGTVKGAVTLGASAVPKPREIDVTADKPHCLSKGKLFEDRWLVNPKNKGVRYAFVWLAPVPGKQMPIHPDLKAAKLPDLELDQPCCQFVPHALAIRQGQVVIARNSG